MLTIVARRMFSKRSARPTKSKRPKTPNTPLAGIRGRMKMMEQQDDVEAFDFEDMSEFESDFMGVSKSHREHEREVRHSKERLKQQITVQKYFKEKEPRFLTFAETELIRKLHNTNPEEWTRERLSESFPALPETIQKILQSKWSPRSVDRVMQYDSVVVENWRKFQVGRLSVEPILGKHLMKFKDRKIILTDRESLAKQFVAPVPEFKKPNSQLFSSIVQTCLTEKQKIDEKLSSHGDDSNQIATTYEHCDKAHNASSTDIRSDASFAVGKDSEKSATSEEANPALISQEKHDSEKHDLVLPNKKKKTKMDRDKAVTFGEFVKLKLDDIYKESPEEGITLLNVYKKQMEAAARDKALINAEEINASKEVVQKSNTSDHAVSESRSNASDVVSAKENALDTYVKVWNKKIDTELEYTKPIKIAKYLHKPGMTYRISDCYYDDDGEFLYRIPGVRS